MTRVQLLIEIGTLAQAAHLLWSTDSMFDARAELRDLLDLKVRQLKGLDAPTVPVIVGPPLKPGDQ